MGCHSLAREGVSAPRPVAQSHRWRARILSLEWLGDLSMPSVRTLFAHRFTTNAHSNIAKIGNTVPTPTVVFVRVVSDVPSPDPPSIGGCHLEFIWRESAECFQRCSSISARGCGA